MTPDNRDPVMLRGILVALVTPFSQESGDVDYDAIPAIVETMVDAGVSGLIPCGSTGEFTALSFDERTAVVEAYAAANGGRLALVPHVGSVRTSEAVALTAHAAGVGADAVMAVPPFYDKLTWAEVVRYYARMSAAAPELPIMAYHHPDATGAKVTVAQLAELVREVPAVKYLKDSGGDAQLLDQLLSEADGELLCVFNGSDSLTFQGLVGGASGSVWGAASFMPSLAVQLFEAVHDKQDLAEGRRLWRLVRPITELLESNVYPAAVKAGCELVGIPAGPAREPIGPLNDAERDRLAALLEAAGLLGGSDGHGA